MKDNIKNKKSKSMIAYLKIRITILIILQLVSFVLEVVFGVLYFLGDKDIVTLILFIVSIAFGVGCMGYIIFCAIMITKLLYKDIYTKSMVNYDNIAHFHYDFKKYSFSDIIEFKKMNDKIDAIKENYSNVIICTVPKNYDDYKFKNIELFKDLNVISSEDLLNNLTNFINSTRTYRNVLASFKLKKDEEYIELSDDKLIELATLIKNSFKEFNPLLSYNEKEKTFVLYVPCIDSLSILKSKLEYVSSNFFLLDYNVKEDPVTALKISAVIYPYSGLESMLSHLKYAERKNDYINLYIPDLNSKSIINKNLYSEKIGEFNKLIENFLNTKNKKMSNSGYIDVIKSSIKNIIDLMGFDCGGIVTKNFDDSNYTLRINYFKDESKGLPFSLNMFTNEFIKALSENKDFDSTYVFYNSSECSYELKKVFDIYGIVSGYIYVIYKDGGLLSFIYYFNFDHSFVLDNYSKESMLYYSTMLGNYFNDYANNVNLNHYKKNFANLLTLSHFKEYTINKTNYKLVSVSSDLKDCIKDIEVGDLCYKKLYKKDSPCEDCPLNKFKKKVAEFDGVKYLYNYANVKENKKLASMLLAPLKESENYYSHNRFDPVLLLNTPYSLFEELNNKYALKGKGYLLLIKIENKDEIVSRYKEIGYNDALIYISDKIKELDLYNGNVYLYNSETLALLLNEFTRNKIFELSEAIGRIVKDCVKENEFDLFISSTQYVYQYPLTYVSAVDFIRNVEEETNKETRRSDNMLIFKEDNISRPISREEYILRLLNESFNKHSFDIRILPMIKKETNSLFGGEILLRLKDELTNNYIDAYEFIDVAIKNQKMYLFTNLIIEQIGRIYKQYGQTIFRVNCLDRLSINLDASYFSTNTFVDDIAKLLQEYNFNKGFLSFELNELEICNNIELIKDVVKRLKGYSLIFVCDNYSGKYLSLEKLSKLGFDEIKIGRDLTSDIDSNPLSLNNITLITNEAKNYDMKVTLVGIERKEQLNVIKDNKDVDYLQGYYYYKPLETDEFLSLAKNLLLKIPLN